MIATKVLFTFSGVGGASFVHFPLCHHIIWWASYQVHVDGIAPVLCSFTVYRTGPACLNFPWSLMFTAGSYHDVRHTLPIFGF
jgi:hypothetical protein